MENTIILTQLSTFDIKNLLREELQDFFAQNQFNKNPLDDEIGGIDLAVQITGLAKPTIYSLVSESKIPHSKPSGKKLYFSRRELEIWIRSGRRKTQAEIAAEAETFNSKQIRKK